MQRNDGPHMTEILIWNEGDQPGFQSYRITCTDCDISLDGERVSPTAFISLLTSHQPTIESVRRLAREYDYVADVAEQLQAEKRAKFAAPTQRAAGEE